MTILPQFITHRLQRSFSKRQCQSTRWLIGALQNSVVPSPNCTIAHFNRIYHLLRSSDKSVFEDCNQGWFDAVVTLGMEPDALIVDVDHVVKRAAIEASADEFFRLQLLAQRISFRYDTLFAQSAGLIANALIILGRPQEALQHVFRHDNLIIGPDETLWIAYSLLRNGYRNEALYLLERLHVRISEIDGEMEFGQFISICSWQIQTILMKRLAGGGNGMKQVAAVVKMAHRACSEHIKDDPAKVDFLLRPVDSGAASYFLTFRDEYAEVSNIKAQLGEVPPQFLPMVCTALLHLESTVDSYHLSKSRKSLAKIYNDLIKLAPTADLEPPIATLVTDTLIRFGASVKTVEAISAKGVSQSANPPQIRAKNGVDVNHESLQDCLFQCRITAFLDKNFRGPRAGVIAGLGWIDVIEHLISALYCCDGRARRAKVDFDEAALTACREQLKIQVLQPLRFTLQERANWNDSYAIPENVFPAVYRQVAELLADCFPDERRAWLDWLIANSCGQWGMYSEGFRTAARLVLTELTREKLSDELTLRLLNLLHSWRDHVIRGVENRHELVPELLLMIPICADLGASEEAERLYQHLLSVSMGPSWYKEDQLGIMSEGIRNIAISKDVMSRLPKIAGLLERASGEMTFQRYVRAEKGTLIGQLAKKGKFRAALAYFRRQCCGSMAELWAEAQQGPIDKVSSLRGNRFPGGALDDQAAILALVRNSNGVSWALRWALLEIFHCGDRRHLEDFAATFAKIANEVGAESEVIRRAKIVRLAETPADDNATFTSAFRSALKPELHQSFECATSASTPIHVSEHSNSPAVTEITDEKADKDFFLAGVFGHRSAMCDADKILKEAEGQWALGNRKAAKALAVKVLQTVQNGGWDIWGNLSDCSSRAEEILVQEETSAANVIRYYAPLIEAEHYAAKWTVAQHLIQTVGPLLTEPEAHRLIDTLINHVGLMVGDSSQEIQSFDFLAEDTVESNQSVEFFKFIVWLCDHPQWLRRDRSAAMLLWLVEQVPELFTVAVITAFSMETGYGPDVLCGVLDGISARDAVALWDKISGVLDISTAVMKLKHVSRLVVLQRLALRAEKGGSSTAKSAADMIKAQFALIQTAISTPTLPNWAKQLERKWPDIEILVNSQAMTAWQRELEGLCSPLKITDAMELEVAVSTTFRDNPGGLFNRWLSKLRCSLNFALWSNITYEDAVLFEAIFRNYNPSHPDRTVKAISNSVTDQLLTAIKSGDYSTVLCSNATVILNYHDFVINASKDETPYVEVLCVFVPFLSQRGSPKLVQYFLSSEVPEASTSNSPFETCCRLKPESVFFGPFTPAIQLKNFQSLANVKDDEFVRQNWRYGRQNDDRYFGKPEREGCSLSVSRARLNVPSGFKLAWFIWLNEKLVAFVDQYNNRMR